MSLIVKIKKQQSPHAQILRYEHKRYKPPDLALQYELGRKRKVAQKRSAAVHNAQQPDGKAYNDDVQHKVRYSEFRMPVAEHVYLFIKLFHIAFLSQDIVRYSNL